MYSKKAGYSWSVSRVLEKDLKKFKHLFRKLEWWENRLPEEMPEYYKYSGTHGIYKTQFQHNGGIVMLDFKPTETVPCKLSDCLPATEAEYNSYLSSVNKEV